MLVVGGSDECVWVGGVQMGGCTVMSKASWIMATWEPPCEQTDACENNTFPQLNLMGGK